VVQVDAKLGNLGVLLEPTTVVAKAWEHIERIGARARWQPATVLVTGAGPIGLLAALLGVQRGLDVHVLDRAKEGLKPELVASLGAKHHHTSVAETNVQPDVVIECTGASEVVLDVMDVTGNNGVVCLTGVSSAHQLPVDVGMLNRRMVLSNDVVFGSVNANRRHYELGAAALAEADPAWLNRLITRRVPLTAWRQAYERRRTDVKVVLEFA
jgi:threonine dehydrogenase-like Zn-dependent dehydrogenase